MQGNAIKHLQEGNLARLQQVTIELLEPKIGRVMGSIPDVNFVEDMGQMPVGESIGKMLNELKLPSSESGDQGEINECEFYSMAREKQGKPSTVPSPATKVAEKEKGRAGGLEASQSPH